MMESHYLFGVLVVSFLAVTLFFRSREKKRIRASKVASNSVTSAALANPPDGSSEGADIIIVGAGVAGSALAYSLAKDGRNVHVIERDLTEPDRIVGELLHPAGYLKLVELDLQDSVEDIDAQRVLGYAFIKDGNATKLPYPLQKFPSDVAGRSFHNGRFIQRMRKKVSSLPNARIEHGTVTTLLEENGTVKGVIYKTKTNGEELLKKAYAPLTIVCDGCFSNLRRTLCSPKIDVPSNFVGMILENCKLPFPNHGHVIFADPSLILFYPISSTEVRCAVDVPGQKIPSIVNGEMANYLKTVVAPQLPPELHEPFVRAIKKENIRSHLSRSMPAAPHPTPGALLLGDALNIRHPLTGAGMTVALSDVVILRNLLRPLRDLHDASSICKYLESFYTLRMPVAFTINIIAGAMHKVFSGSPDKVRNEMRRVILGYLNLGGVFSAGPISLLSGLSSQPLIGLVVHLFAGAIYAVFSFIAPFPSPKRIWILACVIFDACSIILPVMKAELGKFPYQHWFQLITGSPAM
ncbi:hypothetical protein LUZ61_019148 [Rhynchospora tenuis]|uniref:Squalene monooxygenase n=1 Tax=Rhynchospora tenuis TaxID=198213 RepID=A0AAD5ZAW0_9POAL|nr:hypothetical protein LUZ61_019148 [Rhynchospora tenuis]